MKKLILIAVILLAFAATSAAQQQMKPVFYAGGGIAMPIGPTFFKDYWKMGIGFGGGVGLQFSPQMEVIGKFYYNTFGFDWDKVIAGTSGVTGDGLDFQAIEFGVDFKYMMTAGGEGAPFKPFFIAGVGFAQAKFTDGSVSGGTVTIPISTGGFSETKLALSGGAGFDYMFSPQMGFWVEGRFAMIVTEGESTTYLPLRAGIKLVVGQ
jgi:opacity protein-like surface antigen